eukprot:6285581-Prymnesium_polylepis.1
MKCQSGSRAVARLLRPWRPWATQAAVQLRRMHTWLRAHSPRTTTTSLLSATPSPHGGLLSPATTMASPPARPHRQTQSSWPRPTVAPRRPMLRVRARS